MSEATTKPQSEEEKRKAYEAEMQRVKELNHEIIKINAELEQRQKTAELERAEVIELYGSDDIEALRVKATDRIKENSRRMALLISDADNAEKQLQERKNLLAV